MSTPVIRIPYKPTNTAEKDCSLWEKKVSMHNPVANSILSLNCDLHCSYKRVSEYFSYREKVGSWELGIRSLSLVPMPHRNLTPIQSKSCESVDSFQKCNVDMHLDPPVPFEIGLLKILFFHYWLSSQLLNITMGSCWLRYIFRFRLNFVGMYVRVNCLCTCDSAKNFQVSLRAKIILHIISKVPKKVWYIT